MPDSVGAELSGWVDGRDHDGFVGFGRNGRRGVRDYGCAIGVVVIRGVLYLELLQLVRCDGLPYRTVRSHSTPWEHDP